MGKVRQHLMMSLDGFAAGPGHSMDWMSGVRVGPDTHHESIATLGAVLGGVVMATTRSLSQDIARQCVERGLIDEFRVHLAPVMLGAGVRLFNCPGIEPVRWARIHDGDPAQAVDLRYRPA
ncbi:dihydrofolate reductase family protein [Nonomuraea fuscirosea]